MTQYILAVLTVLVLLSSGTAFDCTYTSTTGYQYDFTRFREIGDLVGVGLRGNDTYFYQVCADTIITECEDSAICVRSSISNSYYSAGSSKESLWTDGVRGGDSGVTIDYSGGSLCDGRQITRVHLDCYWESNDQNLKRKIDPFGGTYISKIDDADECNIEVRVLSGFACATNKGYPSECHEANSKQECFGIDCACEWCGGSCQAIYEECLQGGERWECDAIPPSSNGHILLTALLLVASFMCMAGLCCVLFKVGRRQGKASGSFQLEEEGQRQRFLKAEVSSQFLVKPSMAPYAAMPVENQQHLQFYSVQYYAPNRAPEY